MSFLGKERWGVSGLGSSACKIPNRFPSESAFELHLPRQTPYYYELRRQLESAELALAASGYRRVVKVPDIVPGKIPNPASISGKRTKTMSELTAVRQVVKYEEVASDPTAVWRVVHLRPPEEPRGLPDRVPSAELKNEKTRRTEDLRRITPKSTQGKHWMGAPEGNFNPLPTGYSAVSNGWGQNLLPSACLVFPNLNNLNPSHGPKLARHCPQYSREPRIQSQFQYPAERWDTNLSKERVLSVSTVDAYLPSFVNMNIEQTQQNDKEGPKQGVKVRVDTQPPQKYVITGYGIDGNVPTVRHDAITGVSNEMKSQAKQEILSIDKKANENVLEVKNETNDSTDATVSKPGEPKIKGVLMTELSIPKQIQEHIISLRLWVGQSKAKAENENSIQLCKVEAAVQKKETTMKSLRGTGLFWKTPPWPDFCIDELTAVYKSELKKMRHEVEEERMMLQMARVWRVERVQRRLVVAKLTVDSKYAPLNKLQSGLEEFLSFHRGNGVDDRWLWSTGLLWNLPPWPDLSLCEADWMAIDIEKGAAAMCLRMAAMFGGIAGQEVSVVAKKETSLKPFIPVNFNLYWSLIVICYPGEVETFEDGAPESVCAIWETQRLSTYICLNDSEEKLGMASGCILETGSIIESNKSVIFMLEKPMSNPTKIHTISPETDTLEKPANKYSNLPIARNEKEDDSGWETISHVEEQGSSNSPDGSDPSAKDFCEVNKASVSGTDWDENCENCRPNVEISEFCSTTVEKYRKKGSSFVRLWRSSNGDGHKRTGSELLNSRLSAFSTQLGLLWRFKKKSEMGIVGTVFGFYGFGFGFSAGIVMGYYLFIYFQPTDVKDVKVRPLVEYDSKSLDDILPEIPLWVKNSDYERIDWLNRFLEMTWPYLNKAISRTAQEIAKPIIAENFFDSISRKWTTKNTGYATYKRGFVQFCYEPIKQIIKTCMNDPKDKLWPMLQKLGVTMKTDEKELIGKALMKRVMQTWLPAITALIDMTIFHLPSPSKAQEYRVDEHNVFECDIPVGYWYPLIQRPLYQSLLWAFLFCPMGVDIKNTAQVFSAWMVYMEPWKIQQEDLDEYDLPPSCGRNVLQVSKGKGQWCEAVYTPAWQNFVMSNYLFYSSLVVHFLGFAHKYIHSVVASVLQMKSRLQDGEDSLSDSAADGFFLHERRNSNLRLFSIDQDGVSESQFTLVLNIKLDQIIDACKFFDENWSPKLTLTDNVSLGPVVDNIVSYPQNCDFYMCSHAGMIGITRPTHYHTLHDEDCMPRLSNPGFLIPILEDKYALEGKEMSELETYECECWAESNRRITIRCDNLVSTEGQDLFIISDGASTVYISFVNVG